MLGFFFLVKNALLFHGRFLAGKNTFLYNWGFKVGFETWFGFQVEFKINVVRVSKYGLNLGFESQV